MSQNPQNSPVRPLAQAPDTALPSKIAIDGPVASGKTTIGNHLADRLGYLFFDTGVMYRAITYLALRELGAQVGDTAAVTDLAARAHLDVQPPQVDDGRDTTVMASLAEPEDLTWLIRSKEVENHVSLIAAMQPVRQVLTEQMRRVGLRGRVVMVGRDVGTVILPEADLKVFLTASVETRALRRFEEEQARGGQRSFAEILQNLRERDRIDSSRLIAPLRPAEDAHVLDSTNLSITEVLDRIEALVRAQAQA
jgi:cytidylate kinase